MKRVEPQARIAGGLYWALRAIARAWLETVIGSIIAIQQKQTARENETYPDRIRVKHVRAALKYATGFSSNTHALHMESHSSNNDNNNNNDDDSNDVDTSNDVDDDNTIMYTVCMHAYRN